jgi:hypothetical protein
LGIRENIRFGNWNNQGQGTKSTRGGNNKIQGTGFIKKRDYEGLEKRITRKKRKRNYRTRGYGTGGH